MYLVERLLTPGTAADEANSAADGGAGAGVSESRADPGPQTRTESPATENLTLTACTVRIIPGPGVAGPGRLRRRGIVGRKRDKQPEHTQKHANHPTRHLRSFTDVRPM